MNDLEELLHNLKTDAVPSDTFRQNARIRILNTIASAPHIPWFARPRLWGYTAGAAAATVVLSVGTVFAAQNSLPGSALYPVKVLSEDVALTLSPTESLKTTVAQTIISRRVSEVEEVKKQGSTQAVDASISHLNEDVSSIQKRTDVSQTKIEEELSKHKNVLEENNKNDEHKTTVPQVPQVQGESTHKEND